MSEIEIKKEIFKRKDKLKNIAVMIIVILIMAALSYYTKEELLRGTIDGNHIQENDLNIVEHDSVYKIIRILLMLMTVFLLIMYYLLLVKRVKTEHAFIFALVVLEMIYMITIIPSTVPDERTHEYGAYYISSRLLGRTAADDEGRLYMRKCDVNEGVAANAPNREQYDYFYGNLLKKAEDTEIVSTECKPLYSIPMFNYIVSGAGIALGRILGFNQVTTLMLGRMFNLIFYVVLCYYALRQLPFGKCLMMTIMLLPISLQQAMSFSYDVILNAMSFASIAVCMKLTYDRNRIKLHDYIMYVVLSIFIMQSKGGAYIPLSFLILLPIGVSVRERKNTETGSEKYRENSERIKRMSLSMAAAFTGVVIIKGIGMMNKSSFITERKDNIIEWAGQPGYTVGYFVHNPLKIINIIGSTVYGQFDFHLRTFLGGELGWLKIQIPWFMVLMCLLCMLLAAIRVQGENEFFTKRSRIFVIFICVLCLCMCYGGMLLEWTPNTSEQILGVQGRYFIPFSLPLFLTVRSNIITLNRSIDRYLLFFMVAVQPFILYCIEHDAMCVR